VIAQNAVANQVRRILVEILDVELPSDEADVFETGRLDSLGLVEVIFAIEREFGVTVPSDQLEIEHFRSVRSIAAFVTDLDTRGSAGFGADSPPGA
jgi:methoxymalonate biosynthesis acyl carrier protein